MFDELTAYLELVATPEQKTLCLDACTTLLQIGEERHVEPIDDELLVAGSVEGDPLTNIMQGILLPTYVQVLNEYGIMLHRTLPLDIAVDLLKGLAVLDNYDNPEAILTMVETDHSPEEILAELMVLGGRFHAEDYLQHIREVSPDLLKSIEANASSVKVSNDQDLEPSPEVVERVRQRVRKYLERAGELNHYLQLLLDDGLRLAIPFTYLLAGQIEYLRTVADNAPDNAGVFVVGLAAASDLGDDQIITVVDQFANHTFTETQHSVTFRNSALKILRDITSGS